MIDKKLLLEMQAEYQQWNEQKALERAEREGQLSPAEAWQQYLALADFAHNHCPPVGEWYQERKLKDLRRYYARIRKFEARRRAHGKTPRNAAPQSD